MECTYWKLIALIINEFHFLFHNHRLNHHQSINQSSLKDYFWIRKSQASVSVELWVPKFSISNLWLTELTVFMRISSFQFCYDFPIFIGTNVAKMIEKNILIYCFFFISVFFVWFCCSTYRCFTYLLVCPIYSDSHFSWILVSVTLRNIQKKTWQSVILSGRKVSIFFPHL